jgi:hypothetical protein
VGQRLLFEERAGAGAADPVHVGLEHAPVAHVDELGVLPADLDDRQAAPALGVEAHRRGGVRHDLVQHGEPVAQAGPGGAHDGGDGVAPRAGEAHGHDGRVGACRPQVGHEALGGLDRVAVGAPVHVDQHRPAAGLDQHPLGAR